MLKYDVSGVGLNLGTAEEFVNKTVRRGLCKHRLLWRCRLGPGPGQGLASLCHDYFFLPLGTGWGLQVQAVPACVLLKKVPRSCL
jgi:hypothetical protein